MADSGSRTVQVQLIGAGRGPTANGNGNGNRATVAAAIAAAVLVLMVASVFVLFTGGETLSLRESNDPAAAGEIGERNSLVVQGKVKPETPAQIRVPPVGPAAAMKSGLAATAQPDAKSSQASAAAEPALPAAALPATVLPATTLPASALPASALPASALPASAIPTSALPSAAPPAVESGAAIGGKPAISAQQGTGRAAVASTRSPGSVATLRLNTAGDDTDVAVPRSCSDALSALGLCPKAPPEARAADDGKESLPENASHDETVLPDEKPSPDPKD